MNRIIQMANKYQKLKQENGNLKSYCQLKNSEWKMKKCRRDLEHIRQSMNIIKTGE